MTTSSHVVTTSAKLPCDAQRAWEKVCFYEHIVREPSWLLRVVLPVPQRTTGAYQRAGDVSRCLYSDGGYLTKKITRIEHGRLIEFDIIEQTIRYAGRIALKGGTIRIEPSNDGASSVHMLTRYEIHFAALRFARWAIDFVVSAMHRIVMHDMQDRLQQSAASTSAVASAKAT